MCPTAPPGEGLFKEGDGQQSLPPYSHQETRREKWGRTFTVSSTHDFRLDAHEQHLRLSFGFTGHVFSLIIPSGLVSHNTNKCGSFALPVLAFFGKRAFNESFGQNRLGSPDVKAAWGVSVFVRVHEQGKGCFRVHTCVCVCVCLCATVTATNLCALVASPSESAMAR